MSALPLIFGAFSAAALCGLAAIIWNDGETEGQQALRFVLAAQLGAGCMGYRWLGAQVAARASTAPRRFFLALLFLALQLHPVLVAAAFRLEDWVWALLVQLAAMAGAGLVAVVPRARRLDTALLAVAGATAFEAAVLGPTRGVEWFVPFYAAMIIGAFALGIAPQK